MKLLRTLPLVIVLALAGCGDADDATEPASPSTPASASTNTSGPTVTPSPTAETAGATIAQYASLVASHEGGWRDSVATIDEVCTDPDTIPACTATYLTASYQAQTLGLELSGAPDDLGDPPAEISDLIADTEAAASDYVTAYEAWDATGCDDPLDLECGVSESFDMDMALNELTRQFDAWGPYTG